ncbi:hypothetical protein NDU88_006190 [Pleurodeles waltl]|uniref:Uncharacterized protein n=1 Tax=Pleurodeles waltl TaxID=8319 RepID=A0AAV7QKL5_PLEWA|nr:hypothetical protein NDU88_006190 [Pleurodeles waltl]
MVWRSSLPRDLHILSVEGRGYNGFTALSQPSFWDMAAATLSDRFLGKLCPKVGRHGPYSCCILSDCFSSIIMSGFKLRAWIVARGSHTTPHSLKFRFVLLLSLLVAKVSEPFALFNGWCGGPHLHGTFVSSQPRAAVAAGSLLCRGRHFGSRQPRSFRGEFSGQTLPQGGAPQSLLVPYILRSLLFNF